MTDYLGRLAARALGAASSVQPRLPSAYEPVTLERASIVNCEPVVAPGAPRAVAPKSSPHRVTSIPALDPPAPPAAVVTRDLPAPSLPTPRRDEPRVVPEPTAIASPSAPAVSSVTEKPAPPAVTVQSTSASVVVRSQLVQTEIAHPVAASPQPPVGPSPPVRVTIGRVEVRAVTPPAAVQQRALAPKPGALPLAEYLRRRSEGRA